MVQIIDDWYFGTEGMHYVLTQRITTSKGNGIDNSTNKHNNNDR